MVSPELYPHVERLKLCSSGVAAAPPFGLPLPGRSWPGHAPAVASAAVSPMGSLPTPAGVRNHASAAYPPLSALTRSQLHMY